MTALLVLLGLLPDPALPRAADLARFPSYATCCQQRERVGPWALRLRELEGVRGWEGGLWAAGLADLSDRAGYWELLGECHLFGPAQQERALARLRQRIGPVRYAAGWAPALLPELPALAPPVPPPAAGGANGR